MTKNDKPYYDTLVYEAIKLQAVLRVDTQEAEFLKSYIYIYLFDVIVSLLHSSDKITGITGLLNYYQSVKN